MGMHKRRPAAGAGSKDNAKVAEAVRNAAQDVGSGRAEEEAAQEYIVLNRQEEEDAPRTRSLADYKELGRYQYFDIPAIRKSMRLTKAVSQKAEALRREKR